MDRQRIILFDGVCNLCNGFVQFLLRRDPGARFRFGTLQSAKANDLLQGSTVDTDAMRTVVYVRNDQVMTRSTAALWILRDLRGPWSLCYGFIIVPRPLRDAVYDLISANRYRWFGARPICMVPDPEWSSRFIDGTQH